jgi:hypothetical protein
MFQCTPGPVAQWLEPWTHNPLVPGSNPGGPTNRFQLVFSAELFADGGFAVRSVEVPVLVRVLLLVSVLQSAPLFEVKRRSLG